MQQIGMKVWIWLKTNSATVALALVIIRASAVGEKEVNFPESEIRCQISPLNN